ncbi:MAG: glycosyltransferase family 9 protein, partial [Burkholderiaceae bacterium]
VDQQVLSLDQWPQRLSRLKAVVGVDSGLLFLALACAVPALGIYLATDPGHVGLIGASAHRNLGGKSAAVSVEEVLEGLEAMGVMAAAA